MAERFFRKKFNKRDFFYFSPKTQNKPPNCYGFSVKSKEKDEYCKSNIYINDPFCYQRELCKNKENVEHVLKYFSSADGSSERYKDIKQFLNSQYIYTINITIGIIVALYFIHKYKNNK